MHGAIRATVMVAIVSVVGGCRDYQRYKQLETYRMMSLIAGEADRTIDGVATDKRRSIVLRIVERRTQNGRDAWGNPIRFYERRSGMKYEWVIVSCGSDGRPDVKTDSEYFTMREKSIHNIPTSDIVFRDGMPLTEAGK